MDLSCYLCKEQCRDISKLRLHMITVHQNVKRDFRPPYRCGQENCINTFDNLATWTNHIRRCHRTTCSGTSESQHGASVFSSQADVIWDSNESETSAIVNDVDQSEGNATTPSAIDSDATASSSSFSDLVQEQKSEALLFISQLQCTKTVTETMLSNVLSGTNRLTSTVGSNIKSLISNQVGQFVPGEVLVQLLSQIDDLSKPLDFASSVPKMKRWLKTQAGFTEPQELLYGQPQLETTQQNLRYDSYQYVPIMDTLRTILENSEIKNRLIAIDQCRPTGFVNNFTDGIIFKLHPLFSDSTKCSVALELYYDDLETTNPLGTKTIIHKVGLFYFTIKNLPPHLIASPSNIFLLALCYTDDLKRHGYNIVLSKIAMDIRRLENDGITLSCGTRVFGSIGVFLGDNLARHTIFGFLESFRANRFCSTCMATQVELQRKFTHDEFILRTENIYNEHLEQALTSVQKQSEYGLKRTCALNQTMWHVTTNFSGDLMHDMLEGVAQFEIKLMLHHFVKIEQRFSLETVNNRIATFCYGTTDKKNRPSSIPSVSDVDTNHSLKQKAFQAWCLLRLLPIIVADLIPKDHPIWQFYLELRRISDLLFCQRWTLSTAEIFEALYADHLVNFKKLFPKHSLIPKHHFLLHYGHFAIHSGPPYKNMVARHEIKGNFFKRIAHVNCCFKNLLKTLAMRHQYNTQSLIMSGQLFNDNLVISPTEFRVVSTLPCSADIAKFLSVAEESKICISRKAVLLGHAYSKGVALPLRGDDRDFVIFGAFDCLVSKSPMLQDAAILVQIYETIDFDDHKWAFIVEPTDRFEMVKCDSLLDHHPLDIYGTSKRNCGLVVLRYALI